ALSCVARPGPSAALTPAPPRFTALPLASSSCSTGCWASATPFCAVPDGAVVKATRPAAPAVPSAVKVTGLPLIPDPAAVAVSVLVPAVGPRVHDVSAAIPLPLVVTGVVGSAVPLPEATWKVTA